MWLDLGGHAVMSLGMDFALWEGPIWTCCDVTVVDFGMFAG